MLLPDRSTYNEFAPDGVTPRPYWSAVIESLQDIGPDELARRWERAERRIRENGVTYNVYTDPQGVNRPLAIDPIPLLIPPEEWRVIAMQPPLARPAPAAAGFFACGLAAMASPLSLRRQPKGPTFESCLGSQTIRQRTLCAS